MLLPTFEQYVTARGPGLLRLAYALCGDGHLAQDLVQDTLVKVHRRWTRIESEDPEAYVRKTLVRTHLSWWRRLSNRETTVTQFPEQSEPDAHPHHQAERDALWRVLGRLPHAQRAVLVLRFYEDLADDRIAELLGCRPVTVRVHAHRGLARLREHLTEKSARTQLGDAQWTA